MSLFLVARCVQFECCPVVMGLEQAVWSKGLGAVVNSQGIVQSPVAREHAGIPNDLADYDLGCNEQPR
jgi:hypothetical protein